MYTSFKWSPTNLCDHHLLFALNPRKIKPYLQHKNNKKITLAYTENEHFRRGDISYVFLPVELKIKFFMVHGTVFFNMNFFVFFDFSSFK